MSIQDVSLFIMLMSIGMSYVFFSSILVPSFEAREVHQRYNSWLDIFRTQAGFFRPPTCPKPIRHFTLLVKPTYRPTTKVSCPS